MPAVPDTGFAALPGAEPNMGEQRAGEFKIISNSGKETTRLGSLLALLCRAGDVIALVGDLGGGKTTFVQGLARGLGIRSRVTSPSFVILSEYEDVSVSGSVLDGAAAVGGPVADGVAAVGGSVLDGGRIRLPLYHFDAWRLNNALEFEAAGFDEYFERGGVCAIEWADNVREALPANALWLRFTLVDEMPDTVAESQEMRAAGVSVTSYATGPEFYRREITATWSEVERLAELRAVWEA